jgi:hypothetical protein
MTGMVVLVVAGWAVVVAGWAVVVAGCPALVVVVVLGLLVVVVGGVRGATRTEKRPVTEEIALLARRAKTTDLRADVRLRPIRTLAEKRPSRHPLVGLWA